MVTGMAEGWRHVLCNAALAVLHPEYFPNSENADAVVDYVMDHHLAPELENFEQAFDELERRGEILPRRLQRRMTNV